LHADEIEIDAALVRALVDRTVPTLADLPLRRLDASGSSNVLFRLGDDLLVRLPRQPGASQTIAKEIRWMPYVARWLPVTVPEIVVAAEPDVGHPQRWSIVRWIEGTTPVPGAGMTTTALVHDLARVIAALRHLPVPPDARADPALRSYRGGPLAAADASIRQYLVDCRALDGLDLDLDVCERVWDTGLTVPGADAVGPPRWLHGDLLSENLLTRNNRLSALLDFGGLAIGDPAVDLLIAWELLDPPGRAFFHSIVGVDEPTWLRGRAWALAIAAMTFPYYWNTMPERCADRLAMAHAVLADYLQ